MELQLNMPTRFVEIEQEEMMYLDGGGYWTHVGHAEWTYTLTPSECSTIAYEYGISGALYGGIAAIGGVLNPYVGAIAGALAAFAGGAAAFFGYGASRNGVRIYFHTMWWGKQFRWMQVI